MVGINPALTLDFDIVLLGHLFISRFPIFLTTDGVWAIMFEQFYGQQDGATGVGKGKGVEVVPRRPFLGSSGRLPDAGGGSRVHELLSFSTLYTYTYTRQARRG